MASKHNLEPRKIRYLAHQLLEAGKQQDWRKVQQIDTALRPILMHYKTLYKQTASGADELKVAMQQLKQVHAMVLKSLNHALKQNEQQLEQTSNNKERLLAYQLTEAFGHTDIG